MILRKPKILLVLATLVGGLCGGANQADASFILRLTQGANSVTVRDNLPGTSVGIADPAVDANAAIGGITFIGVVGNYTLNVTTGLSKPVLPNDAYHAQMDLNSVDVAGVGGGKLTIELTDTDFIPAGPGYLTADVGGSQTNGSVSFDVWKSTTNQEFAEAGPIHLSFGPFTTPSYSGSGSVFHGDIPNPYSMTLVTTIDKPSPGSVSFNLQVDNILPEPASLTLWSVISGLGAVVGWRSRRKTA